MLLDNSNTLTEVCKCFDYALEKIVPKCYIKLRMASLYAKAMGESLTESFAGKWFSSIFSNVFTKEGSLQVLDMFLLGKWSILLKIGLALIKMSECMCVISTYNGCAI